MSKKSDTPAPAGKKPDADEPFEEPGQDESGKTSAPQSEPGPGRKPDPATNKKHDKPRPM